MADIVLSVPTRTVLSTNHAGPRAKTVAIILHATGGRGATLEQEYQGTVNFCKGSNSNSNSCPHVVVGPSEVTRMVPDGLIAWHATVDNPACLGVEISQPADKPGYVEFQYVAVAELVVRWCHKYDLPEVHLPKQTTPTVQAKGYLGHCQTYAGYSRGKSDPYGNFDWAHLGALIVATKAKLFPVVPPPPVVVVVPPVVPPVTGNRIDAWLAAHPEYGTPREGMRFVDKYGIEYVHTTATAEHHLGSLVVDKPALLKAGLPSVDVMSWD